MEKHLKPRQYYIDLYDHGTVMTCRRWREHPLDPEYINERIEKKNLDKDEARRIMVAADKLLIYFHTGNRYIEKEDAIREWMERDETRDKFIETVTAPEDITCLTCGRLMFVSSKHFSAGYEKEPDTMLFFYDCPLEHMPRRAFYDNGKEFRREKPLCPKCHTPVKEDDQTTEEKFITLITCPNCNYTNTIEIERTANKEPESDPNYDKDRAEFCLSEEAGHKFIEAKRNIEELGKVMDKIKEKEDNKETYDKVEKLKKLKIIDLEKLLAPILESAKYIKLQFQTPQVGKDVFIPFIVYDAESERVQYDSIHNLRKLLNKTLEDTNWRLMSEGINYRLGMLDGRLRAYEREEDLVKLVT